VNSCVILKASLIQLYGLEFNSTAQKAASIIDLINSSIVKSNFLGCFHDASQNLLKFVNAHKPRVRDNVFLTNPSMQV
jgi:hypothetical protein